MLWQLTDEQQSVRAIAQYASGTTTIIDNINYDSFGNVSESNPSISHTFAYTGMQWDPEMATFAAQYYDNARYYDPYTGRFFTHDPANSGPNPYEYADNDPINMTDPTGLSPFATLGNAIGSAVSSYVAPYVSAASSAYSAITSSPTWSSVSNSISSVQTSFAYEAQKYNFATSLQQSLSTLQPSTDITQNPGYFNNGINGGAVATVPLYGPKGTVVGSMGTTGYNGGISSDAVYSALSAVATRGSGLAQTALGFVQAAAGAAFAAGTEGAGAIPGYLVAARGLDNIVTGFNTLVSGQPTETITRQAVTALTGDERAATVVEVGSDFFLTPYVHQYPGGTPTPTTSSTSGGPYSNLSDSPSVGPGKNFTAAQKSNIYQQNAARNNGILRSDLNGEELVMPTKSQRGITPPSNEAQIDHIIPKNPADPNVAPGTNSYSNAQVLSRQQNSIKSNR